MPDQQHVNSFGLKPSSSLEIAIASKKTEPPGLKTENTHAPFPIPKRCGSPLYFSRGDDNEDFDDAKMYYGAWDEEIDYYDDEDRASYGQGSDYRWIQEHMSNGLRNADDYSEDGREGSSDGHEGSSQSAYGWDAEAAQLPKSNVGQGCRRLQGGELRS